MADIGYKQNMGLSQLPQVFSLQYLLDLPFNKIKGKGSHVLKWV